MTLFGFKTKLEKDLFLMLISISGIGPKLAVNILSGIGPRDLVDAIALGDALRLQAIPGVGKKTAERIALELKDRTGRLFDGRQTTPPPAPEGPAAPPPEPPACVIPSPFIWWPSFFSFLTWKAPLFLPGPSPTENSAGRDGCKFRFLSCCCCWALFISGEKEVLIGGR